MKLILLLNLLVPSLALAAPANSSTEVLDPTPSTTISIPPDASATPPVIEPVSVPFSGDTLEKQGLGLNDAASLSWSPRVNFRPEIKADGEIELTMWSNGNVHLWSKFHTADLWCYDYLFVCGVRDFDGRGYFFSHQGKLAGSLCLGSSTNIQESNKKSPDIEAFWSSIVEPGTVTLTCRSGISISFSDLFDALVEAMEGAGKIVSVVWPLL
jgi:hypothetical protein